MSAVLDALAEDIALRAQAMDRPFLVGLDGAVAAGKTTLANQLAERLVGAGLATAVISADGFLQPTAVLRARGLGARKGFPESFDRDAMVAFLQAARDGRAPAAPRYSHLTYDPAPEPGQQTAGARVVIFEGVNVLGADLAPLYDLAIYLDADAADAQAWFLTRFVSTPFSGARAAALAPWKPDDGDVEAWGRAVWAGINGPNLAGHISTGRERATVVLRKASDHSVTVG